MDGSKEFGEVLKRLKWIGRTDGVQIIASIYNSSIRKGEKNYVRWVGELLQVAKPQKDGNKWN